MANVNVVLAGTGPVALGFLKMILNGFISDADVGYKSDAISIPSYGSNGIKVVAITDSSGFAYSGVGFSRGQLESIIGLKTGKEGQKKGHFNGTEKIAGVTQIPANMNDYANYVGIMQFIKKSIDGQKFVVVDATSSDYTLSALSWALTNNLNSRDWGVVSANKRPYALDSDSLDLLTAQWRLFHGVFDGSVYNRATVGADLGAPLALAHVLKNERPDSIDVRLFGSGTCNMAVTGESLSAGFNNAVRAGCTETYPIEDAEGGDLLRKAIIFAREIAIYNGIPFSSIRVKNKESLLDQAIELYMKQNGKEGFDVDVLKGLKSYDFVDYVSGLDEAFSQLQSQAASTGCVLRYCAEVTYDRQKNEIYVSTGLKPFPLDNPAAGLTGRNNLFLINYDRKQLAVGPGPGAGHPETPRALLRGTLYHAENMSPKSGLVSRF